MKAPLTILILAASLVACGKPAPKRTLRTGMLDVDGNFRELRGIIGVPASHARAQELVNRMATWGNDPLFANHVDSARFQGSAKNFKEHHEFYLDAVSALKQAIESKDPTAMRAYAKVNMSCEVCHREFRPGI